MAWVHGRSTLQLWCGAVLCLHKADSASLPSQDSAVQFSCSPCLVNELLKVASERLGLLFSRPTSIAPEGGSCVAVRDESSHPPSGEDRWMQITCCCMKTVPNPKTFSRCTCPRHWVSASGCFWNSAFLMMLNVSLVPAAGFLGMSSLEEVCSASRKKNALRKSN